MPDPAETLTNSRPERRSHALGLPRFTGLYWLTAVVVILVSADAILWWSGNESLRAQLGWNLSFIAAIIGGARFIYHAVVELLEGRLGTDAALALALGAALILNEQWVAAEVVLIALVGESLEAITFRRTQRELRKLLELQPRLARVRRDDGIREIEIAVVQVGDIVVIRPGERIPVDGEVIAGHSAVDQSTLTGESVPVDKDIGSDVYTGTLNQLGALDVRVSRVGEHSTIGQLLSVVAAARRNKANVERLADRLTRYFLPVILLLAGATFVATNWSTIQRLLAGEPIDSGKLEWMPTLAVLVVACPCALVLATPAAMLASLAWLARRGAIVTGGAALERLASVTHVVFDKTGTLTEGKLQVAECVGLDGHDPANVLRLAAAAEQVSEHLIARAILHAAHEQQLDLPPVTGFEALPGAGVQARLHAADNSAPDIDLLVGNRRLLTERGIAISPAADQVLAQLENRGLTPLLICHGGTIIGVIGVGDTIRPEAAHVIQQLRLLGIQDFAVLSGDRPAAVRQVANAVGIDRFVAELRPTEKANWIVDWNDDRDAPRSTSSSTRRRTIAMVGDGINDAPALATADVGIALRSVGSEFAAEAGDVILLGDPLRPLPSVVRIARETVRVIYQNVVIFAFAVNLLGIVLTAWVMPVWSDAWRQRAPVAAALFHQVGSVLVLMNAMRLLWFERWQTSWLGRLEAVACDACAAIWTQLSPIQEAGTWAWRWRGILGRIAAVAAILLYLSQILVFVEPDEVAVIKRFGRVHSVLPPGPHLRLPPPFDLVIRERPARVRTIEVGLRRAGPDNSNAAVEWNSPHSQGGLVRDDNEPLLMTGDKSLVEVAVAVQYSISDVIAFRFGTRDPEGVLRALTESVVREVVAARPLLADATSGRIENEILTEGRRDVESEIHTRLQHRANKLSIGVTILRNGVCLQDVHPPLPVVDAFRDVSSAIKEFERMKNEGDAYRREKIIRAAGETAWRMLQSDNAEVTDEQWLSLRQTVTGEAFAEISAAEGFSVDRTTIAAGDAQSFLDQQSVHQTNPGLTEWRLYMDAVGAALANKRKLLLDQPGQGRRHLFLGFPNGVAPPSLAPPPEMPREDE